MEKADNGPCQAEHDRYVDIHALDDEGKQGSEESVDEEELPRRFSLWKKEGKELGPGDEGQERIDRDQLE